VEKNKNSVERYVHFLLKNFNRVVRNNFTEKTNLSKDMERVKEQVMWVPRKENFNRGKSKYKSLRQHMPRKAGEGCAEAKKISIGGGNDFSKDPILI
jgi:hypothetical protein